MVIVVTTWGNKCFLFLQIRKTTSANIPALAHVPGAGGPGPAQDTGKNASDSIVRLWCGRKYSIMSRVHKHDTKIKHKIMLYLWADGQRAGLGAGPIQGVGGGPKVHDGGRPTPGIEAAAVDLGENLFFSICWLCCDYCRNRCVQQGFYKPLRSPNVWETCRPLMIFFL